MNGILVVFGFVFLLVGLYLTTYIINSKTKTPEGVAQIPKCSTCGTSGACALKSDDGPSDDEACEYVEM